jgi:hypothetical protein
LSAKTKLEPGADAVAAAFLEITLRRRNLTLGELALLCGWTRHALVSQSAAGFTCLPLRWRIEQVLDFVPIWSTGSEANMRQRCFATYGLDPRTAPLPALIDLCRKLRVESPSVRRQEEWQANLLAWFAAHPKT